MNIVSMIAQFLAPALVNRLAASFGISPGIAQKAIEVLLPTILAGIVGKAATPAGAGGLFDILRKQDPGMLGKLGELIGGPQQAQIAQQGTDLLGGLLGTSALGSLLGAAGKFTGVGDTAAKGLAGMLAPAILGTLGQQQRAGNLDAGGMASLLMGQKDNIAAAVPPDFAKLLGGTGLLDAIGPNLAKAQAANVTSLGAAAGQAASNLGQTAARSAADTGAAARAAVEQAKAGSSFNWWPWAIAILAAGLAWYYFMAGPRIAPRVSLPAAPTLKVGNEDFGGRLGTVLSGLQGSLGGIRDVGSANAAIPKLREASGEIDRLSGLARQLPADAKQTLANYILTSVLPVLQPLVTGLTSNQSLAPILKPVLDQMLAKISAMSRS